MTDNPDVPKTQKAFVPLENDANVMNDLVHNLGFSQDRGFSDVYSINDADLLGFVPRPSYALLLVFPVTPAYEEHRKKEDATLQEYTGHGPSERVMWFKQTIRNSCGLIALLHAVANGDARTHVEEDSDLDKLLRQAQDLEPSRRADLLYDSKVLESAHANAANLGGTDAPQADDDVDLHFVAFVKADGQLWELDGRRKGPLARGPLKDDEDALSETALNLGVRKFIARGMEEGELRFSLVSLSDLF
ncbi:Ubiquitin carboxyl-terminal hydrolase isozyme L3 [Penicillium odoratum]|uniref:Ubiquitin carboxyl-terminal hydrolase isozyme L3 n=1 Tax=Penicillium odoratum TaxID=1167516 RepID=UPI00254699B2|nr:Ubiquitin carboxyl-terminal hydrolase isozyme L3 [Penicillium odoratum]KAJ5745675.1 Ubiquitin carboxyl-terminal hydrolase isozyme L3 [Penicillium odoratum]